MKIRHYSHLQTNLTTSNTTSNQTYEIRNGTLFIKGKTVQEHVSTFPLFALILIFVAFIAIIAVIVVCLIRKKNRDKF